MTIVKTGGTTRSFVPRSLGTPLALTERKYADYQLTNTAIVSGVGTAAGAELDPATQLNLCSPTAGDDYNQRGGRSIQVLAIRVRGFITIAAQVDQTAIDVCPAVRIVLVQDRQTNSAQLNSEDVITTHGFYGPQNPSFFGRFQVLKDKTINLRMPSVSYDGTNMEQAGTHTAFKINHKFKVPVEVHFNSTNGGTVADIVDNSFHILGFASDTGMVPQLRYFSRVVFMDV